MKLITLAAVLGTGTGIALANCTREGEHGWNKQLHDVCFTETIRRNTFVSPDKQKTVVAQMMPVAFTSRQVADH
jgi:hypothetical protein